jgi:hypothetical protein
MIEVTVGWGGQLQRTEANVVKCFVVNAESLICVFCELMHRQSGVVRLDYSLGYLEIVRSSKIWLLAKSTWYKNNTYFGGWNDAVCFHDPIRILFSDFGKQECSQTAAGSSSQGVSQLETWRTASQISYISGTKS